MVDLTTLHRIAVKHRLPIELVTAIASVESNFNDHAIRYEPPYRYLWDVRQAKPFRQLRPAELNDDRAPADFRSILGSRHTEWVGQQMSWGAMQIMGAVARENGFSGWFPELCGEEGIEFGCRHLAALYRRFHDKWGMDGVISAYNAGSPRKVGGVFVNQSYVDKVRKQMET